MEEETHLPLDCSRTLSEMSAGSTKSSYVRLERVDTLINIIEDKDIAQQDVIPGEKFERQV